MRNIEALALTVQKLVARLKFQRGGQNDRQDKNNMPPDLRSQGHKNFVQCHKKRASITTNHLIAMIPELNRQGVHEREQIRHLISKDGPMCARRRFQ